jgi:exodeoxyribonuclease V alpha subunit
MSRLPIESDAPREVDEAFAALLQRLDPATDPRVLHAARRAMHAVAQGHAALDLHELARESDNDAAAIEHWRTALQTSRWVATPDADEAAAPDAPLVLEGDLLYLRRYREYERRLALGLQHIASHAPDIGDLAALAPLFAQLFPNAKTGDDQARAAALALARNLLLVTGGPGTGKTTTLARMLVLLIAQHRALGDTPPRIALAAPTGRAADRMAQSMAQARDALHAAGVDATLLDTLPTQARTLHRLLGPIPDRPRFRHDAAHPLVYDVVVVDEASMVDLPLMCKLVEAIADGATLVLVGDPDQLPSVEAGDVLASIVHAAGDDRALPAPIETALAPLLGTVPPHRRLRAGGDPWTLPLFEDDAQPPIDNTTAPRSTSNAPLAGHRVHLRRGWRQTEALDLAPLADAVRAGNSERALALLQAQSLRGVTFHPSLSDPLATSVREQLLAPWRALAQLHDPRAALEHAARVRLLTALRGGPQGAVQLNARIEEALAGIQRERYFHGRLLLVTENSYRHGLFNGDIGVCLRDAGGATVAWFANGTDVRAFHPGTLPAHEGAFAMTVHKAQGSEFDAVWLLLPQRDNRVLSRELVYTGITRARRELHVAGSAEVIEAALARHAGRWSGLERRLRR